MRRVDGEDVADDPGRAQADRGAGDEVQLVQRVVHQRPAGAAVRVHVPVLPQVRHEAAHVERVACRRAALITVAILAATAGFAHAGTADAITRESTAYLCHFCAKHKTNDKVRAKVTRLRVTFACSLACTLTRAKVTREVTFARTLALVLPCAKATPTRAKVTQFLPSVSLSRFIWKSVSLSRFPRGEI